MAKRCLKSVLLSLKQGIERRQLQTIDWNARQTTYWCSTASKAWGMRGIDMKIGIVEDEAVWRNKIQAVIENYCRDKNISFQINSYGSGKDFMENPDADLLFLDIELAEGEDGFGIAD